MPSVGRCSSNRRTRNWKDESVGSTSGFDVPDIRNERSAEQSAKRVIRIFVSHFPWSGSLYNQKALESETGSPTAGWVELSYNPSRPQRDANKCAEAFRTAPDQSESATRKGFGRLSDTYRPQWEESKNRCEAFHCSIECYVSLGEGYLSFN